MYDQLGFTMLLWLLYDILLIINYFWPFIEGHKIFGEPKNMKLINRIYESSAGLPSKW